MNKHCEIKVRRFKFQSQNRKLHKHCEIKVSRFKVRWFKVQGKEQRAGSQVIKAVQALVVHRQAGSHVIKVPRFKFQGKGSRFKVEQMVVVQVMGPWFMGPRFKVHVISNRWTRWSHRHHPIIHHPGGQGRHHRCRQKTHL